MLVNAGKWNAERIVIVKIPAANDRDVFWDAYSVIKRVIHSAHRQRVIEAEYPIGSLLQTQELAHCLGTAQFRSHIPLHFGDDVVISDFKTCSYHCAFVSVHATNTGTGFRPTNVRDVFAADVD
jgi:hypothetical protein